MSDRPNSDPEICLERAATDDPALEALTDRLLERGGRTLLFGAPGTGKSTLCRRLAISFSRRGQVLQAIGADPGTPAFGIPAAVCLGEWRAQSWQVLRVEALCSLDAGRFRLPLARCVRSLALHAPGPLIVDSPGVCRGVAGAELLSALVDAAAIDTVVTLCRTSFQALVENELTALDCDVYPVEVPAPASRPGKPARARTRTALWDEYVAGCATHAIDLADLSLLGTPPPRTATRQWRGRVAALIDPCGRTAALGEIEDIVDSRLLLRCPIPPQSDHALLVRDARRGTNGLLGSAGADAADAVRYAAPPDVLAGVVTPVGPRPVVRAGPATAALINGVLGDPLLHVRLHHRRRSLLFDLGEANRLPAKIAHQLSDVFLSHAHMDHIAGFLWILRSRMGELPALRVFGPLGITANLRGLLDGILWDRIEHRGPRFEVAEFDGVRLSRVVLTAGGDETLLAPTRVSDGVLLDEPELRVRAIDLDHGYGTRVLAFALETPHAFGVRKDRLEATGLAPGPWLTQLKRLIAAGDRSAIITLPDGRERTAGELAPELLLRTSGIKLVFATDLADTAANRDALTELSSGAHTLFCEASFTEADAHRAERTGHLTTRACGAIARDAAVERLVPFHFSRRYEQDLASVYDEICAVFPRTMTPPLRDTGD